MRVWEWDRETWTFVLVWLFLMFLVVCYVIKQSEKKGKRDV